LNILVSNDDGYRAQGIQVLAGALRDLAKITVVAPDRNCSGASNALTLDRPLRALPENNEFGEIHYAVTGTPTDSVHIALTGLLDFEPDIVVSGINHGANLGDDTLYSGTVAAATEGRFLGFPAIAFSMVTFQPKHFSTGAQVAADIVKRIIDGQLTMNPDTVLNVNIPDLPYSELKGYKITRLGNRHKSQPVIPMDDPKGKSVYWIGPVGAEDDGGEGTDFHAVKEGYVSITPLHTDRTDHELMTKLREWF